MLSPAMIRVKYHTEPVFVTEPAEGYLLVIENPDYIRKDLPKHMPQFIKVTWGRNDWASQKRICEIMEKNFPFEKLQTMIDK